MIERTTAYCPQCPDTHDSDIVQEDGRVIGIIHCPQGDIRFPLSSHAALFHAIRKKSALVLRTAPTANRLRPLLNYLSITNACDLHCTVCGASARTDMRQATFLPVQEIMRRARLTRKSGGRFLFLFGGEPAVHPDLCTIVKKLARLGFHLILVTNGVKIGSDPGFARALKNNGLRKVSLQFDSFREEILQKLGRNYLEQKRKALFFSNQAGLDIGLNCTVTRANQDELGDLISFFLDLGTRAKTLLLNSATHVGRFPEVWENSPDREEVILRVLDACRAIGLSQDDIQTVPAYLPWGLQGHPDCGIFFTLVRTPAGVIPLNRPIDVDAAYARMARCRQRSSFFSTKLLPLYFVWRTRRLGQLLRIFRVAAGLIVAPRRYGFCTLCISNFKNAAFLDRHRLDHCSTAFLTSTGPVKGCLHYFRDLTFPGSKAYEDAHESC